MPAPNPYGCTIITGGASLLSGTGGEQNGVAACAHSSPKAVHMRHQIKWYDTEFAISTTVAQAVTTTGTQTISPAQWLAGFQVGFQMQVDTNAANSLMEQVTIIAANKAAGTVTASFGLTHQAGFGVSAAQPGDNPVNNPDRIMPYSWAVIDDNITTCQNNGLLITFVVENPPLWHQMPLGCQGGNIVPVVADATFFLSQILQHSPPGTYYSIEAANEGYNTQSICANMFANQMLPTLQQMRSVIAQFSPGTLLGSPAQLSNVLTTAQAWFNQFYASGCHTYCDYLNFHFYPGGDPTVSGSPGQATFLQRVQAVSSAQAQYHDVGRPLWVTEWGWVILNNKGTNGGIPDATVAGYISSVLNEAMSSGVVTKVLYYNLGSVAPGFGANQNFTTQSWATWSGFISNNPNWGPVSIVHTLTFAPVESLVVKDVTGVVPPNNLVFTLAPELLTARDTFLSVDGAIPTENLLIFDGDRGALPPGTPPLVVAESLMVSDSLLVVVGSLAIDSLSPTDSFTAAEVVPPVVPPAVLVTPPTLYNPSPTFSSGGTMVLPLPGPPLQPYTVNGTTLDSQPLHMTAPVATSGSVQAGTFFTLHFSNPSTATSSLLANGKTVTMRFGLPDGSSLTAPVTLVTSSSGGMLHVTATLVQTAVVNRWAVVTQFL